MALVNEAMLLEQETKGALTITLVPATSVVDDTNYTESDPRLCYEVGEAYACFR